VAAKPKYIVTDASIYTVRPTVTEHRYRVIEEAEPYELGPFGKFVSRVIGVLVFFWLMGVFFGWH
jgi:hypothetical protein